MFFLEKFALVHDGGFAGSAKHFGDAFLLSGKNVANGIVAFLLIIKIFVVGHFSYNL